MINYVLSPVAIPDLVDMIACEVHNRLTGAQAPAIEPKLPLIKGIHELATFLGVSPARAQKLKNDGVLPYFQNGRTVLFDPDAVLKSMDNKNSVRDDK